MDIGSLTGSVSLEDQLSSSLTLMAGKVKSFAEGFDGMIGEVAIGAGVIGSAIAGAVVSIVALGEEGSKILGVQNAFDHLAESAGTTGEALRGALSTGVKGTVSDMQLMESTSKLLGSGMKLTESQALLMGSAARELGKATGGDATSGLDMMSTALVTGRVRGLQQQIGLIDLAAGELKYAQSIGVAKSELDAAGQLEGKRIAILEATQKYLDRLGISQLSFAEIVQRGKVGLEEWGANLAKAVASSPHITAAMDSIKTAFNEAFGGTSKTLLKALMAGINTFADVVASAAPPVIHFFGDLRDVFVWLKDHAFIFTSIAEGVGAFLLVSQGIPAAMALGTGAMTFFTGSVTIAEVEMENLKLALMGLPATAALGATGVETATIAVKGFVATSGPMIAAIAAITAATMIWNQWSALSAENEARASSAAKQLTIDQSNLATINKTLGTHFTDLGEAIKAADVYSAHLRATIVPLTEETKALSEAARLHKVEVDKMIATLQTAARGIDLTSEAYFHLTAAEQLSEGAEKLLIAALDKKIEQHKTLSQAEAARYEAITASRVNTIAEADAMLKVHGVTLQQIDAMKALGMTEAEIAERLHTTTEALKVRQTEMTSVRDLTRQLADLEAKETQTSMQQALTAHRREYEDAVATLGKITAANIEQYNLLGQIRDKANAQEKVDMSALQAARDGDLQATADKTYNTYRMMTEHASQYSRQTLEDWRAKSDAAQLAVFGIGDASDKAAHRVASSFSGALDTVNGRLEKTIDLAHATLDVFNKLMSSSTQVDVYNFDKMIQGVDTNLAPATYGDQARHDLDVASAEMLARQGWSFEQIVASMLHGAPAPAHPGPPIPGFEKEVVASLATALKTTPTQSQATTQATTTAGSASSAGGARSSGASFDDLNTQQGLLYKAGKENSPEYQALIAQMKMMPEWAALSGGSAPKPTSPFGPQKNTGYDPNSRYSDSSIAGQSTVIVNAQGLYMSIQQLTDAISEAQFRRTGIKMSRS